MGERKNRMMSAVEGAFAGFSHLEVVDESHMHSGPEGAESHFKILLVSPRFEGQSRVDRQRGIYQLLDSELKSGLHALSLRLLTPEEWENQSSQFQSPDCLGGSKK